MLNLGVHKLFTSRQTTDLTRQCGKQLLLFVKKLDTTCIMHKVHSRNSLKNDSRFKEVTGWCAVKSLDKSVTSPSMTGIDEWRGALSTRLRCKLGLVSISIKTREFFQLLSAILMIILMVTFIYRHLSATVAVPSQVLPALKPYNHKYPLTKPQTTSNGKKYKIAVVTDLDHSSKVKESLWRSRYLQGYLTVQGGVTFDVQFETVSVDLYSSLGQGGRGMELSELIVFDGRLLAVDDRTGVVYRIVDTIAVPWVILSDGPGNVTGKGFKCEWATVKDGALYVGGLGKEWTSKTGEVLNIHPQYVKRIDVYGGVQHLDWHKHYDAMKEKAGFPSPGYMIHESGVWSSVHRKWYFLPRRASKEIYNDELDERRAANILIVCDESFSDIQIIRPFGPASLTHGFSSFKFIPGTRDKYILALKSEEDNGKTASYIMVFDLKGNMIMREKQIFGNYKYEGVEFV